MIIDCISDLHGHYPELDGGDLLIIAGDLTARDTKKEHENFCSWLGLQDHYRKKIIISGNHDNGWIGIDPQKGKDPVNPNYEWFEYLCDSSTEFKGLKIWGSPWTKTFPGMNPKCKAFTGSENDLKKKFNKIPSDIDILITHTPPFGILDNNIHAKPCGSVSLRNMVFSERFPKLKLHCFGHIHEEGGKEIQTTLTKFVNASYVNEHYQPVNKPIRVIL